MKKISKGTWAAGIVIGLMAAAVLCLAAVGYRDYSGTLVAEQEFEALRQTRRNRENELDGLVAEQEQAEAQAQEISAEAAGLNERSDRYDDALSLYEAAANEINQHSEEGSLLMSELAVLQEVSRLQDCAFAMNYEMGEGKLTLENGLTIFNIGVEKRYLELCALYLNYVPKKVLDRMAEQGWVIYLIPGVTGTGSYQGEEEEYSGTTYYEERKVEIGIDIGDDYVDLTMRNTLLHEIAHVLDAFEDYASYERPFAACYKKEKTLFRDTKWNDSAEYAARDTAEFYAETLMVYWISPDYLKYNCSDTFDYYERMSARWADEPAGQN